MRGVLGRAERAGVVEQRLAAGAFDEHARAVTDGDERHINSIPRASTARAAARGRRESTPRAPPPATAAPRARGPKSSPPPGPDKNQRPTTTPAPATTSDRPAATRPIRRPISSPASEQLHTAPSSAGQRRPHPAEQQQEEAAPHRHEHDQPHRRADRHGDRRQDVKLIEHQRQRGQPDHDRVSPAARISIRPTVATRPHVPRPHGRQHLVQPIARLPAARKVADCRPKPAPRRTENSIAARSKQIGRIHRQHDQSGRRQAN